VAAEDLRESQPGAVAVHRSRITASTPKGSTGSLLNGTVIDDAKIFNRKFNSGRNYYNDHRPGAASTANTYERLRQKPGPAVTDERQRHTCIAQWLLPLRCTHRQSWVTRSVGAL
jgi:hypothetical protein